MQKKQSNTNSIGETAEGEIGEGTANDYSSQEAARQLEREEAARQLEIAKRQKEKDQAGSLSPSRPLQQ